MAISSQLESARKRLNGYFQLESPKNYVYISSRFGFLYHITHIEIRVKPNLSVRTVCGSGYRTCGKNSRFFSK